MRRNVLLGALAVFVLTGCEDYLRWLFGDYDDSEPIECFAYVDRCTGEVVEACFGGGEGAPPPERRAPERCRDEHVCGCPEIRDPVCDARGVRYVNACEARCAGVYDVVPCDVPSPCACPDVWDPVCDARGNRYPNRCEARCAGVVDVVPCGDRPDRGDGDRPDRGDGDRPATATRTRALRGARG